MNEMHDFDRELSDFIREDPQSWHSNSTAPDVSRLIRLANRSVENTRIERDSSESRKRQVRRFVVVVAASAFAVSSGAYVAARTIRWSQPTDPRSGIACRTEARTNADATVIGPSVDPIASCIAKWESDSMFRSVRANGPIPELHVCVNQSGTVEVFPGDESVCSRLGMSNKVNIPTETEQRMFRLQKILEETVYGRCLDADAAVAATRSALDAVGFTDWQIDVQPTTSSKPCASTSIEPDLNMASIIFFAQPSQVDPRR